MKSNTIVNRTPHDIRVLAPGAAASDDPVLVLPRADRGEVARVEVTATPGYTIPLEGGREVVTVGQRWGGVVGLAAPQDGVYQVVSAIVAAACRHHGRTLADLLVRGDHVRDNKGRIVGCRGLAEASDSVPHMALGAEVWTAYSPAELLALGVPHDLVAAAGSDNRAAMYRIDRADKVATAAEHDAWTLMSRLYVAHFGGPPAPRHERLERYDVAELAEALLVRPHRRKIASVSV